MSKATVVERKRRFNEYLEDNARWMEFVDQLAQRGVTLRWAWQTKASPDQRHMNVHCVIFCAEKFQPSVLSAIVVDYGAGRPFGTQHGFGLFMDRGDGTIAADVEMICKPR